MTIGSCHTSAPLGLILSDRSGVGEGTGHIPHTCDRIPQRVYVTPQVTPVRHIIMLVTRRAVEAHGVLVDTGKICGLLTAKWRRSCDESTTLFMLQLPSLNSISQANTLFYCNYAKDLTAHCVLGRDVRELY